MQKEIKFAVEEIKRIEFSDYEEQEYSIARLGFLSTRPNSHGIGISEDVLRASAPSVLGKWIVADVQWGDATTHTDAEHIVGIVPKEQEVEFVEDDDGYLRAYVDGIISKRYAADFCDIFAKDNERAVSIEAKFEMDEDDNASAFDIKGVTVLGKTVRPSCPESDITFVRFSEQDAEACYGKWQHCSASSALRKFAEERKQSMADDKKLKVDKSKDALSETAWGDVDKSALRDKIMAASNRATLVKSAYMLVESGWEDAPSEHLKYPVMEIKGDTLVYNRYGLASALAYAKQEGKSAVVKKIEKIYKSLGLESDGKEEKMAKEIEFAAVDIGDLWGRLWRIMDEERHWEYSIKGIYEEDNQKFAILTDRNQNLYRLDFSLTEDGLTAADEVVEVKQEFTETDNIKKFAEPENVADYRFAAEPNPDDKGEEKMSEDEMMVKIDQLSKDVEDRDHIIMEKDAELEELRKFKEVAMAKETACAVEAVMAEVRPFVSDEQFAAFREEGLACTDGNLDAWSNKVKATCFSEVKKVVKKEEAGVLTFAMPQEPKMNKQSEDIWTRLRNQH